MAIQNVQLFYQYHYAACAVQKGTLALAVGRVAKIDLVTTFDCDFQLYWTSDYVINNSGAILAIGRGGRETTL